MKQSLYVWLVSLIIIITLGQSPVGAKLAVAATIDQDALVVGNGRRTPDEDNDSTYAKGILRVYAESDRQKLLTLTAYDNYVGAQVAVGDVDADGQLEIITLPVKPRKNPRWRIYNLAGQLQATGKIPKYDGDRLTSYRLAVGNVNDSARAELVLSNSADSGLVIDILKFTQGKLQRLGYYSSTTLNGYTEGSLVEVANVNTSTSQAEIITSPLRGDAMLDLWQLSTGAISLIVEYREITVPEDYPKGLHVGAHGGTVWAVTHGPTQSVTSHVWSEDKGNLAATGDEISTGSVSDIIYDGSTLLYSRYDKKRVVRKTTSGEIVYKMKVKTKASNLAVIDW